MLGGGRARAAAARGRLRRGGATAAALYAAPLLGRTSASCLLCWNGTAAAGVVHSRRAYEDVGVRLGNGRRGVIGGLARGSAGLLDGGADAWDASLAACVRGGRAHWVHVPPIWLARMAARACTARSNGLRTGCEHLACAWAAHSSHRVRMQVRRAA